MKHSEARILLLLREINRSNAYGEYISVKLGYDYSYTTNRLRAMHRKKWILKKRDGYRIIYKPSSRAPFRTALKKLEE